MATVDAVIVVGPGESQCVEELFHAYFGDANGLALLFRWDGSRPRWVRIVHLDRVGDGWRFELVWPVCFVA
jgi:hypothetical protein